MIDRRNCADCIFHDEHCTKWSCRYISRERAETAIDKLNSIVADLVKLSDLKELVDAMQEGEHNEGKGILTADQKA